MSSYALLQAMSGIRADYVLEAEDFLDLSGEVRKPRRTRRRLWTTLLVAAVLLALFTMTAYAMGWFGLRQRMIELPAQPSPAAESAAPDASPAPTAQPRRWVSLNGYVDSPVTPSATTFPGWRALTRRRWTPAVFTASTTRPCWRS